VVAVPVLIVLSPVIFLFTWWEDYRGTALRREFVRRWGSAGKRGLLVYSNSPHWQQYIETNWLPVLKDRVFVLNWSERARWNKEHPFEARLFRRFASDREFNPLAVLLLDRPRHATFRAWLTAIKQRDALGMLAPSPQDVKVIRFWQPFRDFKHGKERLLREAENELFAFFGAKAPSTGA
jgi:hypothetical protein